MKPPKLDTCLNWTIFGGKKCVHKFIELTICPTSIRWTLLSWWEKNLFYSRKLLLKTVVNLVYQCLWCQRYIILPYLLRYLLFLSIERFTARITPIPQFSVKIIIKALVYCFLLFVSAFTAALQKKEPPGKTLKVQSVSHFSFVKQENKFSWLFSFFPFKFCLHE